jgi:hypothetical protein
VFLPLSSRPTAAQERTRLKADPSAVGMLGSRSGVIDLVWFSVSIAIFYRLQLGFEWGRKELLRWLALGPRHRLEADGSWGDCSAVERLSTGVLQHWLSPTSCRQGTVTCCSICVDHRMVPFSLVESARRFGAQRITRRAAADAFFSRGFSKVNGNGNRHEVGQQLVSAVLLPCFFLACSRGKRKGAELKC